MGTDDLPGPAEVPIPYTRRYVVNHASAGVAWRAHVGAHLKKPLLPTMIAASFLLVALVYYAGFDDHYSSLKRAVWAVIWALVTVLLIWTPIFALGYLATKRGARYRWYDGAVLESGFGADAFVTRNPSMGRRIRYDAVKSIDVIGDHVYVRVLGDWRSLMYPRALFPDDEIARIRARATMSPHVK